MLDTILKLSKIACYGAMAAVSIAGAYWCSKFYGGILTTEKEADNVDESN